jgi:4-alpha-glucanotransferase
MRRDGFSWWRSRARRAAALFDAFRVDHVIGLFRTWATGAGGHRDGRFHPEREEDQLAQGRELLDLLLEESGPGRLYAEDLGVVPPFLPAELRARGIPGYKVLRWEREPGTDLLADPATWPVVSAAITGTHDTSTLAVWWEDELTEAERRAILARASGAEPADVPGTLTGRVHRTLIAWVLGAASEAAIFPIQDLFLWRQRFNTPGTVGPNNWSWRMPVRVEHLGAERRTAELTRALVQMVADSRRSPAR